MKGDGLTAHGFMLEVHVKGETKIDGFCHDVIWAIWSYQHFVQLAADDSLKKIALSIVWGERMQAEYKWRQRVNPL